MRQCERVSCDSTGAGIWQCLEYAMTRAEPVTLNVPWNVPCHIPWFKLSRQLRSYCNSGLAMPFYLHCTTMVIQSSLVSFTYVAGWGMLACKDTRHSTSAVQCLSGSTRYNGVLAREFLWFVQSPIQRGLKKDPVSMKKSTLLTREEKSGLLKYARPPIIDSNLSWDCHGSSWLGSSRPLPVQKQDAPETAPETQAHVKITAGDSTLGALDEKDMCLFDSTA